MISDMKFNPIDVDVERSFSLCKIIIMGSLTAYGHGLRGWSWVMVSYHILDVSTEYKSGS